MKSTHARVRLPVVAADGVVLPAAIVRGTGARDPVGDVSAALAIAAVLTPTDHWLARSHSLASKYASEAIAAVQSRHAHASDVPVPATQLPFELPAHGAAVAVVVHDGFGVAARDRRAGVGVTRRTN